ncbi:branched-chain amino acid ABC transporter permease [Streptococcus tangpeifui]|uniref:Branched-chain amino acid ABC transporter, permease protein LivM n=1 Tax=Streptococcus criceti HS-6 TaxID=873449 RepID=G5JTE2_STRCG|nr:MULTISPECIES: branched-chain amino acid ABC transporter permease [Streptococcus]EHI74538.1 branched-chain amino acid ABC transporter, permease protein LivM [Streptococcus criceti HS-6]SUN43578.1 branched-chain amino acid transport system permease [Streptococcus criceti]
MKQNLKLNLIWLALIALIYAVLQILASSGILNLYYIQILMGIGISILMGLGTNLVLGFSGQLTLGQAGFMAIGAYSSAIITTYYPTYAAFYWSILVGAVIAAVVAIVFGLPTLRLKGDYLAIATLGMAEIIRILIINGGTLTNGAAGLTGILPYTTWQVIFLFVAVITILVLNLLRSSMGRQIITLREDEIAAEAMGVNVTNRKVLIFAIGAVISAIAGSLYVSYIGTIVPKDFQLMKSIDYLIVAVLGGLGSITGTIIAGIVLGILNMFLQNVSELRMIIYSIALILVMIFRPSGLLGTKEFTLSRFFKKNKEGNH